MIERFDTSGRFAQAVRAGPAVYLAGQVADDWNADFETQCRQVLARVDRLLAEAGASRSGLLQVQVWLKDLAHYAEFNRIYDAWVDPAAKPARATVRADLIAPTLLIEIMAVATCAPQVPKTQAESSQQMVEQALSQAAAVPPREAAHWCEQEGMVFVDVRDASDWSAARIPGAINAPRGMLEFYIDPASEFHLPALGSRTSKYVFYCGSGARAALAASLARRMGLDACSLAGGFKAWSAAGLPRQQGASDTAKERT